MRKTIVSLVISVSVLLCSGSTGVAQDDSSSTTENDLPTGRPNTEVEDSPDGVAVEAGVEYVSSANTSSDDLCSKQGRKWVLAVADDTTQRVTSIEYGSATVHNTGRETAVRMEKNIHA